MIASRIATRAAVRSARAPLRANVRFASTETKQAAAAGGSSGLVGGLAGGALVFLAGYGYYHFSGAKTIVNSVSSAKSQFQSSFNSLSEAAPEPNEALKWLKSTATSYAAFIPGGKKYVDAAFADLEKVQAKHGHEVDEIVQSTYKELKEASKSGVSMETAAKSWEIIEGAMGKLAELASDSIGDIIDNHPQLKEKVGGSLDQLKGMADSYGPEAKKELDETYQQIKDVVKGGISFETVNKIRKVIEEKTEKVKALGDQAWKKGLEQAKPMLEKNPEVKKLVEENADALKQGNVAELFEKVKSAVSSGNMDDLKEYANKAADKAKNSGMGQGLQKSIEPYLKMIPGGSEIVPKLMKLQEVAQNKSGDAEKILKETYKEVMGVLEKKTNDVEKLADEAKKESKK